MRKINRLESIYTVKWRAERDDPLTFAGSVKCGGTMASNFCARAIKIISGYYYLRKVKMGGTAPRAALYDNCRGSKGSPSLSLLPLTAVVRPFACIHPRRHHYSPTHFMPWLGQHCRKSCHRTTLNNDTQQCTCNDPVLRLVILREVRGQRWKIQIKMTWQTTVILRGEGETEWGGRDTAIVNDWKG